MMTNNEVRDKLIEQYPDAYVNVEAESTYYGNATKAKKTSFRICISSSSCARAGDIFWQTSNNLETLALMALSLKSADAPALAIAESPNAMV